MKKLLFFAALIAAVTFSSCTKEVETTEEKEEEHRITDLEMQELKGKVKSVTSQEYYVWTYDGKEEKGDVACTHILEFSPEGRFVHSVTDDQKSGKYENILSFSGDTTWNDCYQDGEWVIRHEFILTEWGAIKSRKTTYNGSDYVNEQKNVYNEKRQKIKHFEYTNGELYRSVQDITYDENNNILSYNVYDKDGEKTYEYVYTYNKAGFAKKLVTTNCETSEEMVAIYAYKYDDHGNYIAKKTTFSDMSDVALVEERKIEYYE